MYIQSLTGEWQLRQPDSQDDWLRAQVPGGVHTDLLAAGRIPDPFVEDNEKRVQWVAESDWEYRLCFKADPDLLAQERVYLVCDGLDTLATLTLNGKLLGETDNAFRRYRWDVRQSLHDGENELLIRFASPVAYVTARMSERLLPGVSQAIPGGSYLRKAPCQFGWDWGPKLPPIGIWKAIRLEGCSLARLQEVHLHQHHSEEGITLAATLSAEVWGGEAIVARLRVTTPGGAVWEQEERVVKGAARMTVPVAEPRLWWPNGYPNPEAGSASERPLYDVQVALAVGERVLDVRNYRMGLRTLELRREADAWGESFTFVVNGVPIFAKGSNWIPADAFPTRITDAHLERLIGDAAATGHNMLRVWGGGFYEEDRFYDLCDRYGILVWQDFVFSCSVYPLTDPEFLQNVHAEVVDNVRRLRHRASLALWCGNNEIEWLWLRDWRGSELDDLKAAYEEFFHHTLPEWCAAEDPEHAYWPSSPSSDTPFREPNGEERGDAHYWEVWHGDKPFSAYRDRFPRFMSEFGFQALPTLPTIRSYADRSEWNITSYVMEHHQRSAGGNSKIIAMLANHFRIPMDFEGLVYLSQVLQAEAIRIGVEHWRRHRHRVSGTLYWQLNDCWPVASWASLDYYGRWKALHYAARRFYTPVMCSVVESLQGDRVQMALHVSSDLTQPWAGTVRWSLESLQGQVIDSGQEAASLEPLSSRRICSPDLTRPVSGRNRRDLIFAFELREGDRRLALGVVPLVPNKHLQLTDPRLGVDVQQEGANLVFAVTAESLARFVELGLTGADAVFSDNYFDIPAGRTVTVTCPLPNGWTVEWVRGALTLRSLYDTCR